MTEIRINSVLDSIYEYDLPANALCDWTPAERLTLTTLGGQVARAQVSYSHSPAEVYTLSGGQVSASKNVSGEDT